MTGTTRYFLLIFEMVFALLVISCCNTGYQRQLSEIIASLRSASSSLADSKVVKAKIGRLNGDQILVVINSAYAGGIKPKPFISKNLAQEISLNYSVSETGDTFFLLIDGERILASSSVPGVVFQTSMEPFSDNAKIASSDKRIALLMCMNSPDDPTKRQSDYWCPTCKTIQLIDFVEH